MTKTETVPVKREPANHRMNAGKYGNVKKSLTAGTQKKEVYVWWNRFLCRLMDYPDRNFNA